MNDTPTRQLYRLTERDETKAAQQAASYAARLVEIEAHRSEPGYWKRRRTTFGLAKRDASALALQGDPEYQRGRGQGLLDQLAGLFYHSERLTPAYNAGYYSGYHSSRNEMKGWIEQRSDQFAAVLAGGTR